MNAMESEDMLLLGAVAVGGYAVYKIFSDNGIAKTTNAIGDVAQGTADLFNRVANPTPAQAVDFKKAFATTPAGIVPSMLSKAWDYGSSLFNNNPSNQPTPYNSPDKMQIAQNVANAPPIMTNVGMTQSGAFYSTAKPMLANTSTSQGATYVSASKPIGASVGTIFSSGARVVSSGASGKYKTTL